jgi:hypothetical protein
LLSRLVLGEALWLMGAGLLVGVAGSVALQSVVADGAAGAVRAGCSGVAGFVAIPFTQRPLRGVAQIAARGLPRRNFDTRASISLTSIALAAPIQGPSKRLV